MAWIQIQLLLKLNANMAGININDMRNSNTTLVKVKYLMITKLGQRQENSNTTLVKVKSAIALLISLASSYSNTTLVKVK